MFDWLSMALASAVRVQRALGCHVHPRRSSVKLSSRVRRKTSLAASYKESGDLKNAISHYEKVRKHFPNYINAQANLVYLYLESNRKEEAKKLFDELIEKSPDNPKLLELSSKLQ